MHRERIVSAVAAAAVVVAAVGALSAQAQDPAARGAALLADARQALGGEERLAAVKRLEVKGTVRRAAGNVNLEGDLEIFVERPDKFRRNEKLEVGNGAIERTEVLNAGEAWEEMKFLGGLPEFGGDGELAGRGGQRGAGAGRGGQPGGGAERMQERQLQARQTEVARVLLATLLATDAPVRWIGEAISPQATAQVVEVTTPDGTATRLFIDSKTSMPLMLTWTGLAQDPLAALAGRAGFSGRGGRGGRGGFGGGFPGRGGFDRGGGGGQRGNAGGEAPAGRGGDQAGGRGQAPQPAMLQMFLSDYKTVNGIKLPHLLTRGAGGEVSEEWIVKNYRLNTNFNTDIFKQ